MTRVNQDKNQEAPFDKKTEGAFSFPGKVSRRLHLFSQRMKGNQSALPGLTIYEIIEIFPEESQELIPKQIIKINKKIQPFYKWLDELYRSDYDEFTKWFIGQAGLFLYGPIKDIKYLTKLKKIRRLIKKMDSEDRISHNDVLKAKEVPIESLIPAQKKGARYFAQCPFHTDNHASMLINSNNTVKCFSCQFSGDVISLVQKMNNIKFIEAVKWLNNK